MSSLMSLVVPIIIGATALWAMLRRVDIFDALTTGARDGLKTVLGIFPSLVALLSAVYMLRASGAVDAFTALLSPVFTFFGIPAETAPLVLLRPISGSGALSIGSQLISQYGADSVIGRTAAVMLGSTETTFYVLAVYFGTLGIKKSRRALIAALCADLAGFIAAAACVRLFWG